MTTKTDFDRAAARADLANRVTQVIKTDGLREGSLHTFRVRELGSGQPFWLELSGGMMPEIGAELSSESRGSSYTPLGSKEGYSTVTGVTYGESEFKLSLDAAFMRPGEAIAQDGPLSPLTPEAVAQFFEQLQTRGRECMVQVASFQRRGVLRSVTRVPNRGYTVDPSTGKAGAPGTNLELRLKFGWSGTGFPVYVPPFQTGDQIAGKLGQSAGKLGKGLADAKNTLAPNIFEALSDKVGRLRKGIADLRKGLRGVGNLARAPAALANQVLALGRQAKAALRDVESITKNTAHEYVVAGKGTAAAVSFAAERTLRSFHDAAGDLRDALVALFDAADAIDRQEGRRVRVAPNQSLATIAAKELGDARRWPDLAKANGIKGQLVPLGVFEIVIPLTKGGL